MDSELTTLKTISLQRVDEIAKLTHDDKILSLLQEYEKESQEMSSKVNDIIRQIIKIKIEESDLLEKITKRTGHRPSVDDLIKILTNDD